MKAILLLVFFPFYLAHDVGYTYECIIWPVSNIYLFYFYNSLVSYSRLHIFGCNNVLKGGGGWWLCYVQGTFFTTHYYLKGNKDMYMSMFAVCSLYFHL